MAKTPSGGQPNGPDKPAQDPARSGPPGETQGRRVAERKKQYLVSPLPAAGGLATFAAGMGGAQPLPLSLSLQSVEQALRGVQDVEVVRTVGTRGGVGLLGAGMGGMDGDAGGVVVARMTDEKARALHQQAQGRLAVERDQHLHLLDPVPRHPTLVNSYPSSDGPRFDLDFLVLGKDGAPLADAEVSLFGGQQPACGLTGADGRVRVTVHGASTHAVSGVYVKPRADYWSFYQPDPDLGTDEPNVVALHALSDWPPLPGFPGRSAMGWGARAMRLEQVPPALRGQGVRIAVIDSGAATTHTNLNRIHAGFDIINDNPDTWNQDQLSHGSHCAGVIAGADPSFGIRGFAPDAEVHVCKLFPGGQISQLIEALEYCIEHQIDVVNLSLGGTGPSPALEQQILRAKRNGVACIAAAGNSGGPVQYPAASPNVLAVAAVGKIDEFPRDSYHAETINPDVDAQGYFTAWFSCFGPEVDVCAPGVAIVSSVPPNNFAAWDGTSMAAPHVTGLAALVLAHHPAFQGQGRMRSAERVDRLFQLIRLSARRVTQSDATHTGYGMPDALVALGLAVAPEQQAFQGMLASLLGAVPQALALQDPGIAMYPGMAAPRPFAGTGGMGGFPFPFGGLRPQGW
ncbi:S8 family serine peptidase [Massilia sp. TN1-12]|uniref:S8 family serine peptidase n=1 Tax=Massilia paldalensis TaxID=3377675 RepID=UPI0038515EB2